MDLTLVQTPAHGTHTGFTGELWVRARTQLASLEPQLTTTHWSQMETTDLLQSGNINPSVSTTSHH